MNAIIVDDFKPSAVSGFFIPNDEKKCQDSCKLNDYKHRLRTAVPFFIL
jgi:hypothetical protein